ACCELGLTVSDMLRAYLGSEDSPARGRDLHVGAWAQGVLQPISHVGDMVPVTTGIALTFKIRREPRVALTWVGDGSTKTAAAHEGTNFAAVQKLPAIFIIQNNQVALGTRLDQPHLPAALFEHWGKRDPIGMYEEHLKADGITVKQLAEIEAAVTAEVEHAAEAAVQSREKMPPGESALEGVYAKQHP